MELGLFCEGQTVLRKAQAHKQQAVLRKAQSQKKEQALIQHHVIAVEQQQSVLMVEGLHK